MSVRNITCEIFNHHLRILPSVVNPSRWVYICTLLRKWELRNDNSLTKRWFHVSRVVSVTSQGTSSLAMHETKVLSITHKYSNLVPKCTWLFAVRCMKLQLFIPIKRENDFTTHSIPLDFRPTIHIPVKQTPASSFPHRITFRKPLPLKFEYIGCLATILVRAKRTSDSSSLHRITPDTIETYHN